MPLSNPAFLVPDCGTCSFCGKARRKTRAFVGSSITDVIICDQCLALCCRVLADDKDLEPEESVVDYPEERLAAILDAVAKKGPPPEIPHPDLQCSFCAKRRGDSAQMVMGPRVMICDVCIGGAASVARRASND